MHINLDHRQRAAVVAALALKAPRRHVDALASIDGMVKPLSPNEAAALAKQIAEGRTDDVPTVAIVRVDMSGWYSVRRVAEIDGRLWSIYWALPSAIKTLTMARKAAKEIGHLVPGIFTSGGNAQPMNLLTPTGERLH